MEEFFSGVLHHLPLSAVLWDESCTPLYFWTGTMRGRQKRSSHIFLVHHFHVVLLGFFHTTWIYTATLLLVTELPTLVSSLVCVSSTSPWPRMRLVCLHPRGIATNQRGCKVVDLSCFARKYVFEYQPLDIRRTIQMVSCLRFPSPQSHVDADGSGFFPYTPCIKKFQGDSDFDFVVSTFPRE